MKLKQGIKLLLEIWSIITLVTETITVTCSEFTTTGPRAVFKEEQLVYMFTAQSNKLAASQLKPHCGSQFDRYLCESAAVKDVCIMFALAVTSS